MREETTLQEIFQEGFSDYARSHGLAPKHFQAADALMKCRTLEQGGHYRVCPQGHEQRIQYHSCRHRSCPQCSALPKAQWAQKQQQRLLETDHYHIVFTLPHELLPLWRYNSRWFCKTLFDVVHNTLVTLATDQRHLGALPGLILTLHTWGRNLVLHPHIHCLMTGGGLDDNGKWRSTRSDYLFPSRVVRALYRGKMLGALWQAMGSGEIKLPPDKPPIYWQCCLKALREKQWNVRIQPPYSHGRGVMKYLARYVKGGPIGRHRLIKDEGNRIVFYYRDHRDAQRKTLCLERECFIGRVLDHVFEPGQHVVRHYGLYAHRARAKRDRCRVQLKLTPETDAALANWQDFIKAKGIEVAVCKKCGQPLVYGRSLNTNSNIIRNGARGSVQHAVEADALRGFYKRTGPPH